MEYIHFEYETRKLGWKEPVVRLYPMPCMHIGAAQCDEEFIKAYINRCLKDPNGFAVGMGDSGECVTKLSKGDVYAQLLSPQQQMDTAVDWLMPLAKKNKILFGIRGNHGNRIYKETGLNWDKNLCHRLNIPYLDVCAFVNIVVNRSSYDTFWHHGSDSGTSLQGKVTKAEKFGQFIDADAIFTAHSHICVDLPPAAIMSADNANCTIKTKLRNQYICGSGYDSRSGYAEEKAYSPILPSYIVVTLDGAIVEGKARYRQSSEIVRADGQRKPKHG